MSMATASSAASAAGPLDTIRGECLTPASSDTYGSRTIRAPAVFPDVFTSTR
jgi:hypothetical protein